MPHQHEYTILETNKYTHVFKDTIHPKRQTNWSVFGNGLCVTKYQYRIIYNNTVTHKTKRVGNLTSIYDIVFVEWERHTC